MINFAIPARAISRRCRIHVTPSLQIILRSGIVQTKPILCACLSFQAPAYDESKPGSTRQRIDPDTAPSSDPDSKSSKGADNEFNWRSDTRQRGTPPESERDTNRGFFDGLFSAKPKGFIDHQMLHNTSKFMIDLSVPISVVSNDKHAQQNSAMPTWKSPFEDECDQDKMDRMREDCEVTHLKHINCSMHY